MSKLIFHATGAAIVLGLAFVLQQYHPLTLILLGPVVVLIWIFIPVWWDRFLAAWHDGRPDILFRSRNNPPWDAPRRLSELGSRRDRADLRSLRARLTPVPDATPRDPSDYLAPAMHRDRATGQYWCEERFEHGFNQWSELLPVQPPGAGTRT
jgi:hypothetical protein